MRIETASLSNQMLFPEKSNCQTREKRYVDIPPDTDLTSVTLLRIGANPLGSRCTIWIRELNMLK